MSNPKYIYYVSTYIGGWYTTLSLASGLLNYVLKNYIDVYNFIPDGL